MNSILGTVVQEILFSISRSVHIQNIEVIRKQEPKGHENRPSCHSNNSNTLQQDLIVTRHYAIRCPGTPIFERKWMDTTFQRAPPRVIAAFLLFANTFQLSNTNCMRMLWIFFLVVFLIIARQGYLNTSSILPQYWANNRLAHLLRALKRSQSA